MKKEWVRPLTTVQCFEADEYVAACWSIDCNVPYGIGYFEKNNKAGYQEGEDAFIAKGSGCGTTHTASGINAAGPTANAMWQPGKRGNWGYGDFEAIGEAYPVFYFKATNTESFWGSNHHFSKVSDAQWEQNPNAS